MIICGQASLLEDDPMRTPVHVLPWGALGDTWPYFVPNFAGPLELMKKFGAERVVGFVPTGWMYELKASNSIPGDYCSVFSTIDAERS